MSGEDAAGDALGALGREIAAGIGKTIGEGLTMMAKAFHLTGDAPESSRDTQEGEQ